MRKNLSSWLSRTSSIYHHNGRVDVLRHICIHWSDMNDVDERPIPMCSDHATSVGDV
jgi:hypothetical protein